MRKPKISLLAVSVSVASLLLASTTSFAAGNYKENYKGEAMPCPVELVLKDGLYIGLQAGYDSYRIVDDVDNTALAAALGDDSYFTADPRLAANGAVGGLFIGYGKNFPDFYGAYLGLEVFGNWSAAQTDYEVVDNDLTGAAVVDTDLYKTSINIQNNYGISLMPGVKLNPATLFYVRLGWNWARFDVDEDYTEGLGSATPVTVSSSENVTRSGFQYGVGIESTFMDGWSVRAEYNHTGFNHINSDDDDAAPFNSEFSPSDNQFMLGLIYHITM